VRRGLPGYRYYSRGGSGSDDDRFRSRRKRKTRETRRGDEEAEERATIGKAIFALNVAILRSKGYCF
jgi:hypothetical protein